MPSLGYREFAAVGLVFLLSKRLMNLLTSLVWLLRALIWTMRLSMEPYRPCWGLRTINPLLSYFFLGRSYRMAVEIVLLLAGVVLPMNECWVGCILINLLFIYDCPYHE